jgi:hypothetical protein
MTTRPLRRTQSTVVERIRLFWDDASKELEPAVDFIGIGVGLDYNSAVTARPRKSAKANHFRNFIAILLTTSFLNWAS